MTPCSWWWSPHELSPRKRSAGAPRFRGGPQMRRIHRLLIANRGEIAARVIRTCARLGIESVLAASDPDLDSVPARLADRVVRLGPAPASASYLDAAAVVHVAQEVGAQAVHPGYGFLSENPALA